MQAVFFFLPETQCNAMQADFTSDGLQSSQGVQDLQAGSADKPATSWQINHQ